MIRPASSPTREGFISVFLHWHVYSRLVKVSRFPKQVLLELIFFEPIAAALPSRCSAIVLVTPILSLVGKQQDSRVSVPVRSFLVGSALCIVAEAFVLLHLWCFYEGTSPEEYLQRTISGLDWATESLLGVFLSCFEALPGVAAESIVKCKLLCICSGKRRPVSY